MIPRLSYLGPEGTFTHKASLTLDVGERVSCRSIRSVFEAVVQGRADAGIVPAENVFEGAIDETLDLLLSLPLVVGGEVVLSIDHSLIGTPGNKIERVYSHPQALAQCDAWLRVHLPDAERVECLSTGEAAALAAGDPHGAAIGPGTRAGLSLLASSVGHPGNRTRFFVIGPTMGTRTGRDRALIGIFAPHQPGSLHACLAPFAEQGINLRRIESRPSRRESWTYAFVIEIEGHPEDPAVAAALAKLRGIAMSVRVLGAWARPE